MIIVLINVLVNDLSTTLELIIYFTLVVII